MDIEPKRYLARQLTFNSSSLKEISSPAKKKQVQSYFQKQSAIIIDYGSQTIKAGYSQSSGCQLIFRPLISKNRDPTRQQQPTKISLNTSYQQLSFLKQNYKSIYERNIILHFSLLQQCNDYIFSQLSKPNKKIRSRLIVTETWANPKHCRDSLLEGLFQAYEVEAVVVGVDSLFKLFFQLDCNVDRYERETNLVVDLGANATHVFVLNQGQVDYNSVRRINVGGAQSFQLFSKSIILKHPQLKTKLTYSYVRDLYEKFTSVAIDYKEQLRYFSKKHPKISSSVYRNRVDQLNRSIDQDLQFISGVQIDYDTIIEIPQQQIKRKEEIRLRMAQKLRETIIRRKQMKKKMHENQLQNLVELKKKYEEHDLGAHQQAAELFGHHKPLQGLIKKIKSLELKLGMVQQKPDQKKFSLIDIPDHQLAPQKLKFKRMQIYQKKAMQQRKQKLRKKQQQQQKMKQLRENNPQIYLKQLKQKFNLLSQKAKQHKRMKDEMADRKSKYNKKKMQAIARLAEEEFNQEEEDQDEQMRQDEEEDHFSQLDVMEAELRQIDPQYTHHKDQHHLNSTNQLFLTTDLIKCHQIYFEPQIIGVNQMDLIQTIVSVLSLYPNRTKANLLKNVLVVGGSSKITGLKERLQRDLRRQCPVEMEISVKIGKGGAEAAYLAMQNIAETQKQFLDKMSFRRQDYLQSQKINFVQNPWSNPSPPVI